MVKRSKLLETKLQAKGQGKFGRGKRFNMIGYDLYGFQSIEIDTIAERLSRVLGVRLEPHESLYRGGDYYRSGQSGQEEVVLQRNWDLLDNGPAEPEFAQYPLLLQIGPTERSDELQARLVKEFEDAATVLRRATPK